MNKYKSYSGDELEEHFSQFLINSWSYSKVSQFARNEKAFEMRYIYGIGGKSSAITVAGSAYHEALCSFFTAKKSGRVINLPDLEIIINEYIENFPVQFWKLQKTTPTVEECKIKALSTTNALLKNFLSEIETYISEIKEVIDIEVYCDEWIDINGVSIPLPCHAQIDLVFLSIYDTIIIADHKSKASFSDEEELRLSIGTQAITYVKSYEEKSGLTVDECWFIENKYSQNRDKLPQLNAFKIKLTTDVRRLYEVILYEPLRRMTQAVNDPDYVYIINESDNFVDKAEIYEFWGKTMISEIEDFNVDPSKRVLVEKRLKKIRDASIASIDPKIIKDFRKNAAAFIQYDLSNKDMKPKEKIQHVLRSFNIITNVAYEFDGYSSNTYLLEIQPGVKISSIHSHRLDIANALDVSAVRLSQDLVVYKGKSYVAIEFSKQRERDLLFDPIELIGMKIPLGKDNYENTIVWDLNNQSTPHVLICGATGSGKSVSIRSTIEYAKLAGVDNIIIFDPKYEFMDYRNAGYNVFNEIKEIEDEMAKLVEKMNDLVKSGKKEKTLVVFDEFADAVSASRKGNKLDIKEMVQVGNYAPRKGMFGEMMEGAAKMQLQKVSELKSLEENLRVLLQKGRSTGFRIMSATQRASVKVITGDAKVNFPVQICFRVPKEVDSKVVLDEGGAESLAGKGDGLIKSPEYKETVRFQAFFIPELVTA